MKERMQLRCLNRERDARIAAVLVFRGCAQCCVIVESRTKAMSCARETSKSHKGMSREASDHRALVGGSLPSMDGSHCLRECRRTHIVKSRSHLEHVLTKCRFEWMKSEPFGNLRVCSIFFMAMLSAYLLAIALGCLGADNRSIYVGHWIRICLPLKSSTMRQVTIRKVRAMAYLPGILAGVLWAYRKNVGWGMAIAALYTRLHVHANHYQITYYGLFLLGALGITETVGIWRKTGALKTCFAAGSLALLFAGIVGVLPSVSEVFETKEYATGYDPRRTTFSRRGREAVASGGCRAWTENTFLNTAWAMVNGGPLCVQTSKEGIVHIIGENKISQVAHCISAPFYVRFSSFFW